MEGYNECTMHGTDWDAYCDECGLRYEIETLQNRILELEATVDTLEAGDNYDTEDDLIDDD